MPAHHTTRPPQPEPAAARAAGSGTATDAPAGPVAATAGRPPAARGPHTPVDQTGSAEPDAAELISGCREQIDVLDARILTLIQERRAVSERIQRARLGSGGRRVHLSREMEILERYRAELGGAGTRMAMLLLELCRGRG